jgi:hypothetical protein
VDEKRKREIGARKEEREERGRIKYSTPSA